jgi:hypothetical protein
MNPENSDKSTIAFWGYKELIEHIILE